jgi:putative hydrolase of the HAD superfamily
MRAVVFDLFETLVDYDDSRSREFSAQVAHLCGRDPDEFHEVWMQGRPVRETGPMKPYLASLGLEDEATREFLERRRAFTREVLARPRAGAVETLQALRKQGVLTGLITVCSEDTVDVWPETPFAGLFDVEVFSSSCGLRKPDPRIYRIALEQLRVEAAQALFVGDGMNDELAGAERVGMHAVQLGSREGWSGERIDSLPNVLSLVG